MKIEHVAMYVMDLERAKYFFEKYFDGKAGPLYQNKNTGFSSYFISFEGGPRLEIMHKAGLIGQDQAMTRAGFSHIAFGVGSKEKVDGLTARLKADGYEVISGPRTTGDGYYESCILDPEGNQIEITV